MIKWIFPQGTKRGLFFAILKNAICHPLVFLKKLNITNIKRFFQVINLEDSEIIQRNVDEYLQPVKKSIKEKMINETVVDLKKVIHLKKEESPMVSIIIPVYNQWNYTYKCIKSIQETVKSVSYEIIIGDDCSSDETKEAKNYIQNAKVVRNDPNLGFLRNCNNAAKEAKGKYIILLNNDTIVLEKWLESLVETIEGDKEIGLIGSKLIYPDERLQEAGGIIWNDASGWNYGRLDDPNKAEYNYLKEVDYISGASIMISAKLWNEIGGFDERYVPAYYEDSDLAFEVRKRGYKVVYQPKSMVVHYEGISHGTDESSGLKAYQVKNKEKFFNKWKEVLKKDHFENGKEVYWARDRSRGKKTILIIDHYVPHFDKDAGSKNVFNYIKTFLKMGYNVKFLADNFAKLEPYSSILEQMGVEVLCGEYYAENWEKWIKHNANRIDFAYLNRPHISVNYLNFIKKNTDIKTILLLPFALRYLNKALI